MITYMYWIAVLLIAFGSFYVFARRAMWRVAVGCAVTALFIGWVSYAFHFEQVFVKRFGGIMSITIPDGQLHIAMTWKDDNLWVENYDPKTNTCYFYEYSKGNVLEGKVIIKRCNPLAKFASQ